MTLRAGARVGPYEVQSPLGAGGMGEVYRARDVRLERSVALKVLPESLSLERERLQRFEKEARSASALNHPNIVTIYEVGTAEGTSYIAMELVEGRTLRELIHAGPLNLRRLLPLAAQAADGLAKAHEVGIVHRDLKPENVMVTKDGLVKILDFGLAKLTQSGEEAGAESELSTMAQATEPGTILGTVGYMSPEQASGRLLDFRSDQFSFGSILYEMATGKRAFERGTKVQTLSAIIDGEPEAVEKVNPKLPPNFCWIVERCLAKEPEGRYAATRDLARDLATLRDHSSEISTAANLQVPRHRKKGRLRLTAAAIAIVAVTSLIAGRLGERRGLLAPLPGFRQLTFRRGFVTGARFAPDGQTVVYSAAWDGKPSEIFTTRIDSPESRPLGISPAGILAVSPAGEMAISLGCETTTSDLCYGTLARVPLSGGAPREVLDDVGSADWSPDGKNLAVIHVVDGRYCLEYPIGKVVYKADASMGSLRVSPKGDLLAFVELLERDSSSSRGVVSVLDLQGHRRTLTPGFRSLASIAWTPESDGVVFAGATGGVRTWLNLVKLSGQARSLARPPGNTRLIDISRDGRALVLAGYARCEIVAPVEGSTGQKISWFDWAAPADLSADGRSLLFYEFGEGVGGEFTTFLRRLDGSDPKRLGDGKAMALSPDQKWALVSLKDPALHMRLLPTGAGQSRDLPGSGIYLYHWAFFLLDGRRFVIAGEEKNRLPRTYVQDMDGGPPRPFGEEGLRISVASPDGKWLAGTTLDGKALLFSADGNGKDPKPIAGVEPNEFLVQWSADGKTLYVRGTEENPLTLYGVDLETGKRALWKRLRPAEEAGFMEFGAGPRTGVRMTPDGRSLVYSYWTRQMDLYLAEGLQSRWQ
jgi:eukaryotic-like serine/threonine-protein kinase